MGKRLIDDIGMRHFGRETPRNYIRDVERSALASRTSRLKAMLRNAGERIQQPVALIGKLVDICQTLRMRHWFGSVGYEPE